MNKLLEKSVRLARKIHSPNSQKFNVYAFMYDGRRLLSIGHNDMQTPSAKAHYFARRFNVQHLKEYNYKHAEVDCISRLWGRYHISGGETLVVVRLLRNYQIALAKPCRDCQIILDALNITQVMHT